MSHEFCLIKSKFNIIEIKLFDNYVLFHLKIKQRLFIYSLCEIIPINYEYNVQKTFDKNNEDLVIAYHIRFTQLYSMKESGIILLSISFNIRIEIYQHNK